MTKSLHIHSPISVFSTYSRDTVIDQTGKIIKNQRGGPLLFIDRALKDMGIPFNSHHGKTINVEIKLKKEGEVGKIINHPSTSSLPKNISGLTIISAIFKEWNFLKMKPHDNKVFIDVQGYVRDEKTIGKKHVFKELKKYPCEVYCLKGTREEISFLPKSVRDEQKKRLLIITHRKKGVEFFFHNKKYYFKTKKEIKSKDTIGAGDTFLGYFVGSLYKGTSVKKSIKFAMEKTSGFLSQKSKQQVDQFSIYQINSKSDTPILGLVVGVHGNEGINTSIINNLKSLKITKGKAILIIANQKAIKNNKRLIEADLNRVFPGKKTGKYEEKLAQKLTPLVNQCDYLVDFHAFEIDSPPFVILPTKTRSTCFLAKTSGVEHIVYMPDIGSSLCEQAKAGIGIELGTMKDNCNIKRGIDISKRIMLKLGMLENYSPTNKNIYRKYYFSNQKYKKPKGFIRNASLANFQFIRKGQIIGTTKNTIALAKENFYPILLDSPSLGENYLCRIGKKTRPI